jgi:glycosyltransferase involved in cell wall biosynthesis
MKQLNWTPDDDKKLLIGRSERRVRQFVSMLLGAAYRVVLPIARHLIPRRIKLRMISVAGIAKRMIDTWTGSTFETRPVTLANWKPMLPAETFTGRPILVNNALAWGGVERQVVYTLLGLAERKQAPAGLLCLRLGYSPDHDFYQPVLKDFFGLVRNVVGTQEARRRLNAALTPAHVRYIKDAVAWMPRDAVEDILRFAGDFAALRPHVVHAWQDAPSIAAGYAARLLGVPRIILSSRNVAPTNFAYFRPYMFNAYQELISCSDITLVNNSEAGAADYARWLGCSPSRFVVKRNGIDTSTFRCPDPASVATLRTKLGIPEGVPVVGSVFRFYDEKRPQLWISAAAQIAAQRPDVHFVIFGTGPRKSEIQSAARRMGFSARLHCPGTIENSALGLSLFNVFVLTSQFEGTPNVIIEASLLGIPVVTTDAGGTRESVREGSTGIVVPEPEPAAIAQAVLAILNDPGWPRRASREGPTFIKERFGLERMLNETLVLYQQPISSSGQQEYVLHRSPEQVA